MRAVPRHVTRPGKIDMTRPSGSRSGVIAHLRRLVGPSAPRLRPNSDHAATALDTVVHNSAASDTLSSEPSGEPFTGDAALTNEQQETVKADPSVVSTPSLPASVHAFLTRPPHNIHIISWKRPAYLPIIDKLPPLPLIHDPRLLAEVINGGLGIRPEAMMVMAQVGDRLQLGHEAFSHRHRYPVARGFGYSSRPISIMGPMLGSNTVLAHLARVYRLHWLTGTGNQHNMASVFEAWIYAAKEDATRRGFEARGRYEAQMDAIFDHANWKPWGDDAPLRKPALGDSLHSMYGKIASVPLREIDSDRFKSIYSGPRDPVSATIADLPPHQKDCFEGHPALDQTDLLDGYLPAGLTLRKSALEKARLMKRARLGARAGKVDPRAFRKGASRFWRTRNESVRPWCPLENSKLASISAMQKYIAARRAGEPVSPIFRPTEILEPSAGGVVDQKNSAEAAKVVQTADQWTRTEQKARSVLPSRAALGLEVGARLNSLRTLARRKATR